MNKLSLILPTGLSLLLAYSVCQAQEAVSFAHRSRSDFVQRMGKVERKMTERQVLSLLGRPDLVKDRQWFYGIDRNTGFPTLGKVKFTPSRIVCETWGVEGTPPSEKEISERELRFIMSVLSRYNGDDYGEQFDPRRYIQTVNLLLPFGKAKILAATFEYCRVTESHPNNLLFLLAILFDPPSGAPAFPSFISRFPVPPRPEDKARIPRFPLVLIEDVPILLMYDCRGDGISGSVEYDFLEYLQAKGRLRAKPLSPSNRPLDLLDKLMHSDQWLFGRHYKTEDVPSFRDPHEEERGMQAVMYQSLRLVRRVLPEAKVYLQHPDSKRKFDSARWQQLREKVRCLPVVWDATRNDYRHQ